MWWYWVCILLLVSCTHVDTTKQHTSIDSMTNLTDSIQVEVDVDWKKYDILINPVGNYRKVRDRINIQRAELRRAHEDTLISLDSVRRVFTKSLLNNLIPFWYGTEWDFNGYTDTPSKGAIACGYFVSTTLKHMGLQLNRYRMAQQSALSEIKTINFEKRPQLYHSSKEAINIMKQAYKDGFYLVGLESHVGFY